MGAGRHPIFRVNLTDDEISLCNQLAANACITIAKRCYVLLALNNYEQGKLNYRQIGMAHNVSKDYVTSIAKQYALHGMDGIKAIARNENSDVARLKCTVRIDSILISLACTPPPSPYQRWTVDRFRIELNIRLTELGISINLSNSTIWRALKRHKLQPHKSEYWCIPEITPSFILNMEYILYIYSLKYDPNVPVVCMDEAAVQLISDTCPRLNLIPGEGEKLDYEYKRIGTKNIFLFLEPKTGKYYIRVTERHTALDWADVIKYMADFLYPDAKQIILVTDNLNTHVMQSLYKAFPPEEARRLVERIRICHTPKHGSWLNIAEIGINVMRCECIGKRFRTESEALQLPERLKEWQERKNAENKSVNWNFTVEKAREKSHLYNLEDVTVPYSCTFEPGNPICEVTESFPALNSLTSAAYAEDDDIIDLCRSVDENGNEYWCVSLADNKVALNEPVGKKKIANIVHQRNTFDGWRIPLPSNSRNKDGNISESKYDYDFMLYGEEVISVYNMPYNKKQPVLCIRLRSYNEKDLSQNGWACNLHVEPKKQNKKNDLQDENNAEILQNTEDLQKIEEDSRLGIIFIYEPHTGKKNYKVVRYADECSIAECLRYLVTNQYPEAEKIHLIICEDDSMYIPSLEQIFSADEALNIYIKLEVHRVPNSARWLNFAEDEAISCVRKLLNYGVTTMEELTTNLDIWRHNKTYIKLNLTLQGFRRAFSKVYKPMRTVKSEAP